MLRIEQVRKSNAAVLIRYCARHGPEHDDSFLPGRDFALSKEYPAYVLVKGKTASGAVILMRTKRYQNAGKGRFSVFHAMIGDRKAYRLLLTAIRPHFRGLRSVYLFLPGEKRKVRSIFEEMGFAVERFSCVLETRKRKTDDVQFPDGYLVRHLKKSDWEDVRRLAELVNRSFRGSAGHIDSTAKEVRAWFSEETHLDDGICLLIKAGVPVGTVRIARDSENPKAAEIGGLAVDPRFRRMGFGRMLLRYARNFAVTSGLSPVILSVNAENEKALTLYRSEGFRPVKTLVCYSMDCGRSIGRMKKEIRR
jgi:mycothiol synthase